MSSKAPLGLADIYQLLDAGKLTIVVGLDVDGPDDVVTDEVLEAIRQHKPLIAYRLAREGAWAALSSQRWVDDPDVPQIDVGGPPANTSSTLDDQCRAAGLVWRPEYRGWVDPRDRLVFAI